MRRGYPQKRTHNERPGEIRDREEKARRTSRSNI
jgi:hypothetical protein